MVPGIQHKRIASFDGTDLAYQVRGEGPGIVLANGLGGSFEAFRHIYAALGERYKILCWDYRGLFGSKAPRDPTALGVTHQCDDLEVLMDHEKIDRAVFIGWSMGVQVNFEFLRRRRARVDGIVAINGTAGLPFRSALASRTVHHVIPLILRAGRAQAKLVGRATRLVVGWEGVVPLMQRFGMVSRTLDIDAFRDVAAGFGSVDWRLYMDTMALLGQHDATDQLSAIDVPALVITGDRDLLTPAFTAERIHRAIRGSRLVVIPGGTHYTPIEYPHVIQEELTRFLSGIPAYAAPLRRAAGGG
ncbi:MAG TPA: alpha/beta hydrolase [Kofleriaceae bacterium]|nr:alpha/beta hydrolase [Kofleriaceae bacterium]